jgi:hypothetical protein
MVIGPRLLVWPLLCNMLVCLCTRTRLFMCAGAALPRVGRQSPAFRAKSVDNIPSVLDCKPHCKSMSSQYMYFVEYLGFRV